MGKKQAYHDEVELEDFEFDDEEETYYYPCPCGDRFAITLQDLRWGIEIATCPSCSLVVKVIYDLRQKILLRSCSYGKKFPKNYC